MTDSEDPNYGKVKTPVTLPVLANIKETTKCFSGWYTASDFSGNPWTDISGVAAGNLVFYIKWADTGLYVAGEGHTVVTRAGNDDYEENVIGTKDYPFATLQKAIDKIKADAPNIDWTINIDGNVSGNNTSIADKKIKSIIIQGATGNSVDKLTGSSGSTISVVGKANVVLQNITITGGTGKGPDGGTTQGGGIYISDASANVTLNSGVLITGNTATNGGGIYIESGNLTINANASIGTVGAPNTATNGGGIYNNGGTITMSGGTIGYNSACASGQINGNGGGVYNASGNFNMSGGSVIKNEAGKEGNVGDNRSSCGGGIYNSATVNLSGDAIIGIATQASSSSYSNYSNKYGGGIYNTGTLILEGTDNCSIQGNYARGDGGGLWYNGNSTFTSSTKTAINNDSRIVNNYASDGENIQMIP